MKAPLQFFSILALILLLAGCSKLFDGGTETGNVGGSETEGLYGTLVLENGDPAAGAVVEVIPVDSGTGFLAKVKSFAEKDTCDSEGRFNFRDLANGLYNLLATYIDNHTGGITVIFIASITLEGNKDLGENTLEPPGSISVTVTLDGVAQSGVQCYIPGTSFLAISDENGLCVISDVPRGTYLVSFSEPEFVTVSGVEAVVTEGEETSLETTDLVIDPDYSPPAPLNLNFSTNEDEGTVTLSWSPVNVSDLRGYVVYRNDTSSSPMELNLENPAIDTTYTDTVFVLGDGNLETQILEYRVKSIDDNHNQTDDFIDPVTVTIAPPNFPHSPNPENNATDISLSPLLSWQGITDPQGAIAVYDVYIGTSDTSLELSIMGISQTEAPQSNLQANTDYYWQVVGNPGTLDAMGAVWKFTTLDVTDENASPNIPANPSPRDSAIDQSIGGIMLTWEGGDPDSADEVVYDLYFSLDNPPVKFASEINQPMYDMLALEVNTTYFWSITASDGKATVEGPVWQFTTRAGEEGNTPPIEPHTPTPADSSAGQPLDITLEWQGGDEDSGDTVTYQVYFGTTSPPTTIKAAGLSDPSLHLEGSLSQTTTYYWQVISTDGKQPTLGPVWSFTTSTIATGNNPPEAPSRPSLPNGAEDTDLSIDLGWSGGDQDAGDNVTYTLLLGTEYPPTTPVITATGGTEFSATDLQANTTYNWQVLAFDGKETTAGPIWSFTTKFVHRVIAHYDFNEGTGSTLLDDSENNNHGTIMGATYTIGIEGTGLYFDGDDGVEVPFDASLNTRDWTLSAWIKTNYEGDYQAILNREPNLPGSDPEFKDNYRLMISTDDPYWSNFGYDMPRGHPYAGIISEIPTPLDMFTLTASPVSDGKWHHVVATLKDQQLKIYLDGQLSNSESLPHPVPHNTNFNMNIGRSAVSNGDHYFRGIIDEIEILNYELDAATILANYNALKPREPGVIAHYNFNEGSGSTLLDDSDNNNHGLIQGATYAPGVEGTGLSFDGNDGVDVPFSASLNTSDWTIGAWVKTTYSSVFQYLVSKTTNTNCLPGDQDCITNYALGITTYDTFHEAEFGVVIPAGHVMGVRGQVAPYTPEDYVFSTDPVADGQWHYIVATMANHRMKVYIDGVFNTSDTIAGNIPDFTASPLSIGKSIVAGGAYYYQGVMDEIEILNYELDAATILANYNALKPGIPDPGLIAHWDFNENTGSILNDKSGNNNHGTITGANWQAGVEGSGLLMAEGTKIDVPFDPSLNTAEFTLEAWIQTSYTGDAQVIFQRLAPTWPNPDQYNYSMAVSKYDTFWEPQGVTVQAGYLHSGIRPEETSYVTHFGLSNTYLADGQWHHVVTTLSNQIMKMYIDGVLDMSKSIPHTVPDNAPTDLTIGYTNWIGDKNHFNGKLDELRILDGALTDTEVLNRYNATKPGI